MRKFRWLAPLCGALAVGSFAGPAAAQGSGSPLDGSFPPAYAPPGPGGYGPPGAPGYGPGYGPVEMPPDGGPVPLNPAMAPGPPAYAANPTYTTISPDAASPAGYPPEMRPWPAISPFENGYDSMYNDDGIWFRDLRNKKRTYKINAEFISGRFRRPGNATIGAGVPLNVPLDDPDQGEDVGLPLIDPAFILGVKDFVVVDAHGRYLEDDWFPGDDAPLGPLPRLADPQTRYAFGPGAAGVLDYTFFPSRFGLVPAVNRVDPATLAVDDQLDADEVSTTILYEASGAVLSEDNVTRFGGDPWLVGEHQENPASPGLRLSFGADDEDGSGFMWTGWWLNDEANTFRRGTDDPNRPRATNFVSFLAPEFGIPNAYFVLDYNQLFKVSHETEVGATDLAFYHTPAVDWGWFKLRPMFGARYNYIREGFNFTGKDNGLQVLYNQDGTPTLKQLPIAVLDDPDLVTFLDPYETSVTSKTKTHLYGPQVGFDMQIGGEHLMLTAVTKTGVLANTERLKLDGYGFGPTEALGGPRVTFGDQQTHTHLSPFVEFNANADANVFPVIPVVKNWHWLKNARLRGGWSALAVAEMSRPLDNIVWRSEGSGGGYIKTRRDLWYTQFWNAGIHWEF